MNHVYRLVFNRALGLLQVTAETGPQQKKSAGGSGVVGAVATPLAAIAFSLPLRCLAAAIALALGLVAMPALADTTLTSGAGPQILDAAGSDYDLASSETIIGTTGGTGGNASGDDSQAGHGGGGSAALTGTDFTLSSDGQIVGGAGGAGGVASGTWSRSGNGGAGGAGVSGTDFDFTNTGTVSGGLGGGAGGSGWGYGGDGGNGGAAVSGSGFTLINSGTLTGGNGLGGGNASAQGGKGGNGGAGVVATGNATIYNSGTISGGTAGNGGPGSYNAGNGVAGNAIELSGGGNTLILQDGSIISGNLISSSGSTNGGDTLILEGSLSNTLNMTSVDGFASYTKRGSGIWSLTGAPVPGVIGIPDPNANPVLCDMFPGDPVFCGTPTYQIIPVITPWDVQAGTLSIDSDASLGDVSGDLTLSGGTLLTTADVISARAIVLTQNTASTIDNGGHNDSFSGVISGNGSLTFAGSGTTTLSGVNTYTGATNINAGTLQTGVANALSASTAVTVASGATFNLNNYNQSVGSLAGAGDVTLGSATLTAGSNNTSTTFSGDISGAGGLTKTGSGTTTLAGVNTYSGATTINAGTLQAGIAHALSTSTELTVASGATFDLNNFNQHVDSLAGSGNVTLGSATLVVGANNSSSTFSGVISGTGGLSVASGGTKTLSGTNTYQGGTTVGEGTTLAVDRDANLGAVGGALSLYNATLRTSADFSSARAITLSAGENSAFNTFDNDGHDATLSGVISGLGSLVLQGSGTTTLSGVNTYTGATQVAGGTLALTDGAALSSSQVVIDYLAELLADDASVNDLNNAGTTTIAAGKTLSVDGDFTNGSTGTLTTSVSGVDSYGKLNVDGTAQLDGTLAIDVIGSPSLSGSLLSVVHATDGVSGTFAQVTDNSILFDFTAVYRANDVDLTISTPDAGNETPATTVTQIVSDFGNTPATGAARALDATFASDPQGALAAAFIPVSGSEAQINRAVTQSLPLLTGGSMLSTQNTLTSINSIIQARQGGYGASSGDAFLTERNVWLKPFGSRADQDDRNGVAGFEAKTGGLALGVDGQIHSRHTVGVAFAYASANVDGNSSIAPQSADIDIYQLIGYGTYDLGGRRELSYQVDLGRNHTEGVRKMSDFSTVAESDYDSISAHAGVGLSQSFVLNSAITLTPSVRADYSRIHDDAYRETGAGALNLEVDSRNVEQLIVGVAGKLEYRIDTHLTASVDLGVGYDTMAREASITAAYAGAPGVSFATRGIEPDAWLYRGGAGVKYQLTDTMDVSLRYDAEARSGFENQSASVKVNWKF